MMDFWQFIHYFSLMALALSSYTFGFGMMTMAYENEWIMVWSPLFPIPFSVLIVTLVALWSHRAAQQVRDANRDELADQGA